MAWPSRSTRTASGGLIQGPEGDLKILQPLNLKPEGISRSKAPTSWPPPGMGRALVTVRRSVVGLMVVDMRKSPRPLTSATPLRYIIDRGQAACVGVFYNAARDLAGSGAGRD